MVIYVCEIHERCLMQMEDCRRDIPAFIKNIQILLKEASECPIQLEIRDRLQDLLDSINSFERVRRTLCAGRLQEAWQDIQLSKERGLFSVELMEVERLLK